MQEKKTRIISIDAIKEFDKVQHPFMTKALSKAEIEVNFHTTIKAIHGTPTANNTVAKDRKPACPEQGTMPTFATSSQHDVRSSSQSKQAREGKRRHSN